MPESDPVIPGLCAFLLGLCYEFNREPGEITRCASVSCLSPTIGLTYDPYRSTIYPLLTRLGIDLLVGRITHLRDDDRFKAVGPDTLVLPYPNQGITNSDGEKEAEILFDWAFVDFWKSNYCERVISLNPTCYLISCVDTIQKGITADPKAPPASAGEYRTRSLGLCTHGFSAGQNAETAQLVASLRGVIQTQAQEIETLKSKLAELSKHKDEVRNVICVVKVCSLIETLQVEELRKQVSHIQVDLQESQTKRQEVEKEQEDLLVLLDELNSKRRRDKERLKSAGLEVSEDEGDDEEEEE